MLPTESLGDSESAGASSNEKQFSTSKDSRHGSDLGAQKSNSLQPTSDPENDTTDLETHDDADADADTPKLPPELLLLVMDFLDASNSKRTLLNLMRTARESFHLGAPIFVRSVNLNARLVSPIGLGFFKESFGQYLTNTRKLEIVGADAIGDKAWELQLAPILRACFPYLEHLSVEAFTKTLLNTVWNELGYATKSLTRIDLTLWPLARNFFSSNNVFPGSISRVDLDFPGGFTYKTQIIVALRDRCPSLEEWSLKSPYDFMIGAESTWGNSQLATKLREVVFDLGSDRERDRFFESEMLGIADSPLDLRTVEFRNVDKCTGSKLSDYLTLLKNVSHVIVRGPYRTDRLWNNLGAVPYAFKSFTILNPLPNENPDEIRWLLDPTLTEIPEPRGPKILPERLIVHETPEFLAGGEKAQKEREIWKSFPDQGAVWVDTPERST